MSDLINKKSIKLITASGKVLEISTEIIYHAESLLPGILTANKGNVNGLISNFNRAMISISQSLVQVNYEIVQAEKALKLVKAKIILDDLPEKIKSYRSMGIKDNADIRESIVLSDEDYQKHEDILNRLRAVKELLQVKYNMFDRSYWDAKASAELTKNSLSKE